MADGPLERQDLVSDDALKAPGILTEEFQKLLDKLDDVVKKTQEYGSSFTTADASTAKMKESTAGLSDEQRVLAQITTQINTLIAKQSDEYIQQVGVLNQLKQATKDKTTLGEQEAQAVTKENSSRNQLLAALNSNRAAYSNLRSEQERNSPEGQKLLKTIQDQDKGFKELSRSMGDNKVLVGGYRSELEELINKFGGIAPELKEVNERATGFGKIIEAVFSPLGLAIGALATVIGITKASLDVFYEDSIQGADELNGKFNFFKASLEVIKDLLFDFGKSASGWLDNIGNFFKEGLLAAFPSLIAAFTVIEDKQDKLNEVTKIQNEIKKEEIKLTVELSALELEKQDELFVARDKANQQLDDRYEALQKAKVLGKEILKDRLDQISNEIRLQQELISVNTKKSVIGLTANQILAQSNELGRVSYEQIEKLAALEAKFNEIQSEKLKGSRRNQALEASLIDEAIKREQEMDKSIQTAKEKASDEEVKLDIEKNNRIKQNQTNSWTARLDALRQSIIDEEKINDTAATQALRTENEKWLGLVTLSKAENNEIARIAGDDLEKRAQLTLKYKQMNLETDVSYQQARLEIIKEYEAKDKALIAKGNAEEIQLAKDRKKQILDIEKQLGSQLISSTVTIANSLFDAQQTAIDKQLSQLDDWHNAELALVGNNAEAKLNVDKEFNKRQKVLQDEQAAMKRKQAIFDKTAAAIDVAFKTSIAIMEAVAASPLTGGLPWSAVVAAMGALQEAAILAKPIPSYDVGTKDHIGGKALVHPGELMQLPSGKLAITPNVASIIDLPEHTKVFTGNETTRMLAMMGLNVINRTDRTQELDKSIVKELQKTNQLLSNPQYQTSLLSDGVAIIESYKNTDGLIKRIRKNVMIG